MAFNNANLQSILSSLLGIPTTYIVPKQGNWFNPQDSIASPNKPDTWVAYRIKRHRPISLPFTLENTVNGFESVVYYISDVDIQLVGTQAEYISQTMSHWTLRQDVMTLFASYDAQLMGNSFTVNVTDFYQEGLNMLLAYNVKFSVQWASVIADTSEGIVNSVTFSGNVVVPS